jgi:predicted amidohydrolase
MRLALHQGPSPAGDPEAAFAAIDRTLAAAAAAGARMAVFPELFLPGYNCADIPALAQPLDGPWGARLATLARRHGCGLAVGLAERDGDRLWNSALALGPDGARLAHYRKVQLYGPREKALFTPGDAACTFDLDGRRTGLLVCYDVEFAPHIRTLAERGVTLLLVPTANMLPFTHVSRVTVPAMAVNHALTIAYANYCGAEGDLTYAGGSIVAGPDGEALATAGPGECLLIVDLDRPVDPARLSTQLSDFREME